MGWTSKALGASAILALSMAGASGQAAGAGSPWEGFYAGGHVGDAFAGESSYATAPAGGSSAGRVSVIGQDAEYGPVFAGFQAGYNHVAPTGLMIGVEGDFSFPDVLFSSRPVTSGSSLVQSNVEVFGSLRGRIGYVFGNHLLFATGGFAYDRDHFASTDNAGDNDQTYRTRIGYTLGGGVETLLSSKLSASLQYGYYSFAPTSTYFPIAGEHYSSNLSFQTVRFGLNYHFNDTGETSGPPVGILSQDTVKNLSIHAQTTQIVQANAPFPASTSGVDSLYSGFQARETFSVTGFLGYKTPVGTELYYNPEPFQGFGLSNTHGLAAFPNLEAQKAGSDFPHYNTSRLFLRQIWGLGGEQEDLPDSPNQVAESVDVKRVTLTFGKFSVPDIFDANTYSHDGRVGFMNWALNDAGAFDFSADQRGYTYGSVLELNNKDWAVRAGYFLLPDVQNSPNFDTRIGRRGQSLVEGQHGYTLFSQSGIIRLTGWESQCYCGSFAATLTNPTLIDPATDGGVPDIAATRKTRSEFGFIGNVEHTVNSDLGLFARLSYQSGQTEITSWTDIDESVSVGAVLKGTAWNRPKDTIGIAGVVNGLSGNYQKFLSIGGLGINLGDGTLNYRPESIVETYYLIGLSDVAALTFDYQFIANPGYNYVRGPVSIGAVRLHFAL